MNGLTVNLHLLMLAFYKPEGMRRKILIEDHAFPSDRYAVRSLLRVKGVRISQFIEEINNYFHLGLTIRLLG